MDDAARVVLVSEARELLVAMEKALLDMEVAGGSSELINAAFRAAHTIKGAAGLFELELITSFTQVLENVLDRVRAGELQIDAGFVSMLLQCCDYLGALVDAIEQHHEHVEPDAEQRESLLQQLRELSGGAQPGRAHALARPNAPVAAPAAGHWHLSLRFHSQVLKNGMDPLAFIAHLRSLGTIIYVQTSADALPSAEEFDPELCYLRFEVGLKTAADRSAIERVFDFVRDDSEIRLLAPQSNVADYIQIIQNLPSSRRRVGELLVASGALSAAELEAALGIQASARVSSTPRIGEVLVSQQLVAAPVVAAALNKQKQIEERRSVDQRLLKVDANKLDQLINLIGELVIASEGARVTAGRARQLELMEAMARVGQIVEYVRDRALDMRMVAIGEVFQRFPRVVRDVSKELGKDIELMISGAETELDKSMVDKLSDPLLHIVRNAIDHGIEPMSERVQAGKRAKGRLRLHAFHESGFVVIEVTDDGRGLHREQILGRAIERGLVAQDAELTDSEVYDLLFLPGFSTAKVVTGLSGRGVGMDVVKRNVEQLRGEIELSTRRGRGTRIRIRLPLTLAIIDGFQVVIDDTVYVIPLESVVECVAMIGSSSNNNQNLFSLRGEPLPYVRLRDVFRLPPGHSARESLVVVSHGQQRVGVVVDRLLGDMQAVIKPLGPLFRGSKAVSSSTILGDGTVALILDIPTLVARAGSAGSNASSPRALTH
jgi:two-component system chemotaxis sensor kinase CheA